MDVLSEVLKVVKLQGQCSTTENSLRRGVFAHRLRARSRPYVAATARHLIIYHLLTEGRASARLVDGERMMLDAGDIVIFPHGDAHFLENGPSSKPMDMAKELARICSQGLKLSRWGGGGEVTKFVCGFMACEPRLSQVFLSGLPPVLKVTIRNDASGRWLENSIRFSVNEADASRAGEKQSWPNCQRSCLSKLCVLYIAHLPAEQTGWLAGARDSEVGKTLALMHRNPAHPWTIASLAKDAGVSRSVLAERFRHYLKKTPMAYLTRWRLQLGAEMPVSTSHSVAQVAAEVGYESEAAVQPRFQTSV